MRSLGIGVVASAVVVLFGAFVLTTSNSPSVTTPHATTTPKIVVASTTTEVSAETPPESLPTVDVPPPTKPSVETPSHVIHMLKDVGEPYLKDFGLTNDDFVRIAAQGVTLIQSNFDICANQNEVHTFLDRAHAHGLQVILPAGAGEAEWGYECDTEISPIQKPVWQKDVVQAWVTEFKAHPALYAWDISNEAGGNFPNAHGDTWKQHYALTVPQLKQAYADVKASDPNHPIMIRMNGWFFYDHDDHFFREGNPFGNNIADIVMINAYSNVDEYFDDFVSTVTSRAVQSIHAIDPDVEFIVALGAWEEPPIWVLPPQKHLTHDYNAALDVPNLRAIAFFKYGAQESYWWFPRNAQSLWKYLPNLW